MNAFEQLTKRRKQESAIVNAATLKISDYAYPGGRAAPIGKYAKIFSKLKPGQAVECKPENAATVHQAMRKWLTTSPHSETCVTGRLTRCADGVGRVWLLPK